jgi:hypothetical protein
MTIRGLAGKRMTRMWTPVSIVQWSEKWNRSLLYGATYLLNSPYFACQFYSRIFSLFFAPSFPCNNSIYIILMLYQTTVS